MGGGQLAEFEKFDISWFRKWSEVNWVMVIFLSNIILNLKGFQVNRLKSKWSHKSLVLKSKLSCKSFMIMSSWKFESPHLCYGVRFEHNKGTSLNKYDSVPQCSYQRAVQKNGFVCERNDTDLKWYCWSITHVQNIREWTGITFTTIYH